MGRAKQTTRTAPAEVTSNESKRRSLQSKAGLKISASRVGRQVRQQTKAVRTSQLVTISLTAGFEKLLELFLLDAKRHMTEKELSKDVPVFRAAHFAAALNDPTSQTYGLFAKAVAGVYVKPLQ